MVDTTYCLILIGAGKLVDQFHSLKDYQQTIQAREESLITKRGTRDNLKTKLDQMSHKKNRFDQFEELKNHRTTAIKKLKWAKFENDIANAKVIKKKADQLEKNIKDIEAKIESCKNTDNQKENQVRKLEEAMIFPESVVDTTEKMMLEPEIIKKMMELEHVEQMIAGEEEEKSDRLKNIDLTKAEVEKISRELKHCSSETVLDNEISKLREKENEINNKIHNLSSSKSELSHSLKSLKQNCKTAEKSLYDLRSAETQKLNQLKKSNADCWGAVMYIRQNLSAWRQSGRFKSGVYEPAALSLSIPNLDHSVFIEKGNKYLILIG